MASLPACLLIVTAEIDADAEAGWNRWYDEVHLPAALACPGVLAGRRYRSACPTKVTDHGAQRDENHVVYTTVYELESAQALDTPEFQAMRGWYEFAGRIVATTRVFESL